MDKPIDNYWKIASIAIVISLSYILSFAALSLSSVERKYLLNKIFTKKKLFTID